MLTFDRVVKRYGLRRVVDDVTLRVPAGAITALAGVNGSGKSTLFKIAAGLVCPDSGDVTFAGLAPSARIAAGLAYIPQSRDVLQSVSGIDNLRIGLLSTGRKWTIQQIADELAKVHLTFVLDLERGDVDRQNALWLLLARAYLAKPQVLIADEPFAGLDDAQIAKCIYILEQIRERGAGILITDHRPGAILRCAQRVYIIQEGRLVYEGTPDAVRSSAQAQGLYFRTGV